MVRHIDKEIIAMKEEVNIPRSNRSLVNRCGMALRASWRRTRVGQEAEEKRE